MTEVIGKIGASWTPAELSRWAPDATARIALEVAVLRWGAALPGAPAIQP